MKKGAKRLLSVLVVLVMLFSFLPAAAFAEPGGAYAGKVIILHSNDVHGAVDGYQYMAGLKQFFLDEDAVKVILVDAGDFSQGTTYVSTSKGAAAVDIMNACGYDIATLGNHEFDYGYAQLITNLSTSTFTVVCDDVKEDGNFIASEYTDITVDDLKIRFIGLETPEAQTKANPALIQGLTFDAQNAMYADAQAAIDAVGEPDVVIALTHLGVDAESTPNRSTDLYANVTGLDFIIDGHSHTVMTEGPNGEPIQSTGTAFANIGVVVIDCATKKVAQNYLYKLKDEDGKYLEGLPTNEAVKAMADEIIADIEAQYGTVFAKTNVYLDGVKGNVRAKETNLGDLITDSMIWAVKSGITEVPAENIVAITNGGGIRANLPAAAAADSEYPLDITMNDVHTVLPFGNTCAVVYVTGTELLEALEASTYCTPTTVGGFPQIAGMTINIDTEAVFDAGDLYPGSTYHGPKTINRVSILDVNGKAFDPEAKYAVVTNNFCAAGGDTYYAFAAATSQFDTGLPLDEVLIDYITNELNGEIGTDYAEAAGRIIFGANDEYVITEGEDQEYEQKTGGLSFTCDGPFDEFLRVIVDGAVVDPANYKASEGSTIIDFTDEYADALEVGDHTIYVAYENDTRSNIVGFTVVGPRSPKTGDSNIILMTVMLVSAMTMLAAAFIDKRRYSGRA